jgi:manganese oxidase
MTYQGAPYAPAQPDPFPEGTDAPPWTLPEPPAPARAEDTIGWWRPLGAPLRFVAAALLVLIAVAHVLVTEDQFDRAVYLGLGYVLVELGSVAAAGLLCWRDHRATWVIAGVVAEVGAVVFVLSRVIRVPEVTDDVGSWTYPLAVLALLLELATLGIAVWSSFRTAPFQMWTASRLPLISGIVALQLGAVATFAVTSVPTNGSPADAGNTRTAPVDSSSAYWATVSGAGAPAGVTRTYYLSADEQVWNYAPTGRNGITGKPFDETAQVYLTNSRTRIGARNLKCLYHGYTDASFSTQAPRPASEAYLGMLGPVIRAAVGDTIKVVFRNACSIRTSVHPHGVFYAKDSEGAPYADGSSGGDKLDDGVPTGGTHTYSWKVPERAGPASHDGSSVMWMYHSHTDEVGDTYAGLTGPMVITAAAAARPDGTPKDVDREIFILFSVMDENSSPYLKANVRRFTQLSEPPDGDEDFEEANLKHSVNGYMYGSQPMITLKKGQRVRWYVMGMGTEVDLHTPHWHGNDVVVSGMRMDVVNLLPASMVVADMVPDNAGVWLFHCHVNDHLTAGMVTRFEVKA